jgi:hypothetical protein
MVKRQSEGFSTVTILAVVLVIVAASASGWFVWRKHQNNLPTKQASDTPAQSTKKPMTSSSNLAQYRNSNVGVQFAYPKFWKVSGQRTVEAANGTAGLVITVEPNDPAKGDPSFNLSTYPSAAGIKDVEAGANDTKVQDITSGDGVYLTIVGIMDDPSFSGPTRMYLTNCWPRRCVPKLSNGKSVSIDVGAINNECEQHTLCNTEINTAGSSYIAFLDILKSLKSL